MSFVRKLRTVSRMSAHDLALITEAFVFVCAAYLVVRYVSFRRYDRWSRRQQHGMPSPREIARRIGWAVERASRNAPMDARCLAQGLAAQAMLARRRFGSTLHLGLAGSHGELKAHAWLTSEGVPVVGGTGTDFAEIAHPAR